MLSVCLLSLMINWTSSSQTCSSQKDDLIWCLLKRSSSLPSNSQPMFMSKLFMRNQSIWSFLCCQFDSDDEREKDLKHTPLKIKPEKTQLELLGDLNHFNYMLVRQTQKNFFVDYQQRKTKRPDQSPLLVYFSYFEKGVRYEQGEEITFIPEKVLHYIARRVSEIDPQLIIDGCSRSGFAAIQFAIQSPCLIVACTGSNAQIKNGIHNSAQVTLHGHLEFMLAYLPQFTFREADVLFIAPEYEQPNDSLFSVNTHLKPNIGEILSYGLRHCKNIVIVLPNCIQLHETCASIAFWHKKLGVDQLKIEIQKLQVDGMLDNYVIYIGEVAAVSMQNEFEMMTALVLEDSSIENYQEATQMLLRNVSQKVTMRELMDTILYARQLAQTQSETTLQQFISQCLFHKYENEKTIKQLFGPVEDDLLILGATPQYNQICQAQTFGNEQEQINNVMPQQKDSPMKRKNRTHISFTKQGVSINHNMESEDIAGLLQNYDQQL